MKNKSLLTVLAALFAPLLAHAGVKQENITFPDGLGSAVLFKSDHGKGPAVVVVHEWWGLNDYARQRAKMLAEAGYTAVAVDMYGHGKVAGHPKDANGFMTAALAEPEKMNARFDAAVALLKKQSKVKADKIYAIGYCFGGGVVLQQARRGLDLAGVASFHGALATTTPAQPGAVKAEILVATGDADPMVPAEQVGALVEEMSKAGAMLTLISYPGAQHGFTNPASDPVGKQFQLPVSYDAEADHHSWAALLRMLAN